jgi:uncharacterized protein (DUF2249 family)
MQESPELVDLTTRTESTRGLAALNAVRWLGPGGVVRLLTHDDPALLMESLNLQLRGALAWESVRHGDAWETAVRRADDVPPWNVVELLQRDHRRLDELLAIALRRLNAGETAQAKPLLESFALGLRRHAGAEDDLVATALSPNLGFEPLQTMLHEHSDLQAQLAAIEQCFAEAPSGSLPEAWEVEPFVAILSGTLAKHEHREEQGLFPVWAARLAGHSRAEQDALLEAVRERLGAPAEVPRPPPRRT